MRNIQKANIDSKTEMRADLYLQDKTKSNLFHTSSVSISRISYSGNIFLALLCSVTLTAIVSPRLDKFSLLFALTSDKNEKNRKKDLFMNIQNGKIFTTNVYLFCSKASGCFLFTLLLEPLLYLEISKRW